ncbi:enoyl-CoA hydratase-related protein [Chryseolinea sp. T2]|uniref:enoyl-CoA hydratase/isomerase family protein n=1 Tax=Chryseolinea sp. T2 TaxID=3129255 RepID=UPI003077B58D
MELISTYQKGSKAVIVLNQPEKRNALSPLMIRELKTAFDDFSNDPNVRAIVLRAEGTSFCSGADLASLRDMQQYGYAENVADSAALKDLYYSMYTSPKPIIAEVQGHALAGGCGLVTVCDFVLAVPQAKFGYTEVRIGFVPAIVMGFLIRRIGGGHARNMLLSGGLISAEKACEWGLITRVVSPDELSAEVEKFVDQLVTGNSGEAMAMTKQMLADIQSMGLVEALSHGVETNVRARVTADCRRGVEAFLRKEKLDW